MLVLGLQGSPRLKGNAKVLLTAFMDEVEKLGCHTQTIDVCKRNIKPCEEYIVCEKKGFCPIKDDMRDDIFSLIRQADVLVMAAPIFFFNVPAQLKALIDRCQTFWALKYRFDLKDPKAGHRGGFLLATAASKGKRLFDGLELTTKYFFDAIDAKFSGRLTYPQIEHIGDMQKHPSYKQDVRTAVQDLLKPLANRKKILIIDQRNARRGQMASAFAQHLAGEKLEIDTVGIQPAAKIDPLTVKVMNEKGIDISFLKPKGIAQATIFGTPDLTIAFESEDLKEMEAKTPVERWTLPAQTDDTIESMRILRDHIETRVIKLINTIG
jgi:multimeric flavodoxin WrbA